MNLPILLASPVFAVWFKWSCLLALGWGCHGILRHRHARWRLILWRSILCFGLILPWFQILKIPGIKIPVGFQHNDTTTTELVLPVSTDSIVKPSLPVISMTPPVNSQMNATAVPGAAVATANSLPLQKPARPISRKSLLIGVWVLGCAWGTLRLLRLNRQLSRVREEACQTRVELQQVAAQTRARLEIQQEVVVKLSDEVTSPFVCGLFRPMVILPRKLAQQLSPGEIAALLSHELAHVRQHDLRWCVAWRWIQVVCWFHPLVWKIPAAHNLACEQEADRIAAGQLAEQRDYAQLLARLALQVLALPPVETQLSVNGSSQIARRLSHLGRRGVGVWNWKYSVAGFGLAAMLFLATVGCEFSKSSGTENEEVSKLKFKNVLVVIQDEDGKPVAGATVSPFAFRVKGIHGADAYGWDKQLFGPPEDAVTDGEGKAYMRYPVEGIPSEKEFTAALCLKVTHPDFATVVMQEYSVDKPEAPVQLVHGIPLEVSGFFGSLQKPVTDLIAILTDGTPPTDWQKENNGCFLYRKISPGGHLLQLMGRLPSGEIVFSDTLAFTAEKGEHGQFDIVLPPKLHPAVNQASAILEVNSKTVEIDYQRRIPRMAMRIGSDRDKGIHIAFEMKPGIRIEGRLDDNVPRPVKNGRVMMDVRPEQYAALDVIEDYYDQDTTNGGRHFWHSYRPINADGTFVFESVPPGIADMVVLGDGFTSKTTGHLQNRVNGTLVKSRTGAIPQAFPLAAPVTKVEIASEPTATLEFTALTQSGKPIEGVWAGMYPSVFRMWGLAGWIKNSSEEPYREIPSIPDPIFSGKTDKNGELVIENIPPETHGMDIAHPHYQAPLQDLKGWRDRHIRITFAPGMTNHFELALEPKGTDFIGSR